MSGSDSGKKVELCHLNSSGVSNSRFDAFGPCFPMGE